MPGLFGIAIFDGFDQTQYVFLGWGNETECWLLGFFMDTRKTGTVSSVFRGSETTCLVVVRISDVGGSVAEMWHLLGSEGFAIFTGQLIIRRPTGLCGNISLPFKAFCATFFSAVRTQTTNVGEAHVRSEFL